MCNKTKIPHIKIDLYHLEHKKLTKQRQIMKQTISMTIMKVSAHSLTAKIRGLPCNYPSKLGKFPDFHYVVQDEIQYYHWNKD